MERQKWEGREQKMKYWKVFLGSIFLCLPLTASAASCTSQASLTAADRSSLAEAAMHLLTAIAQQDMTSLHAALLPAEVGDWEAIHSAALQAVSLVEGGQMRLRNLYLIDASNAKATADTQVFCSNTTGSLTVTITLPALPPGKYAVALADAVGAKLAGQIGLILSLDNSVWKLGGLSAHAGLLDGHDGVWYWTKARELAQLNSEHSGSEWSAVFTYETARYLLVPVSFLSSPNLEKLHEEQIQIKSPPTFPFSLTDGPRSWKVTAMHLDPSLHHADLGISYESMGTSDAASSKTEAIAVLSAFLKAQPKIRENFHGLWAYSTKDGKQNFAMELPMEQIP